MSDTPTAPPPTPAEPPAPSEAPTPPEGNPAPAPTPPKPEETKEEAQVSRGLNLLAKKERENALARRKLADEWKKLEATRKELDEFRAAKESAKRNPEAYLRNVYGENWYDHLTQYRLNGAPPAEMVAAAVDEKLAAFEKKQQEAEEARQNQARESQEQEYQRILGALHEEAKEFVAGNKDSYELIELYGSHALIPQTIDAIHRRDGKVLSVKEAADLVEQYLEEQAKKAQAAKKFQPKAPPPPQGADKRNETPQRRTLSNDLTATTAGARPPPKNDAERLQRAKEAWDRAARQLNGA